MTWNIGDFAFQIIKSLITFTQTLFDVLTMQVDVSWLDKILKLAGVDVQIGTLSLFSILGSVSAGVLVGIIFYNLLRG